LEIGAPIPPQKAMAQTLKKAMAETLNGPNSQWPKPPRPPKKKLPKPPQKQLDQTVEVLPWQSYSVVDSAYAIDGILLRRLQVERQVNLHSAYEKHWFPLKRSATTPPWWFLRGGYV